MNRETGSPSQRSVLSLTTAAVAKVGSVVAAGFAVTDVLEPLAPLALYLSGLAVLLLCVFALPERIAPRIHTFGLRGFPGYWRTPVLATVGVTAVLFFAAHVITRSAPAGGWLGSHVSAVHDVQGELGVLEAQNREIVETTHAIKDDTEEIKGRLDEVKQETSADPRKELANLGVEWSTESFVDALKRSDARVVELFLKGGMSPASVHGGASALLYILQPSLPDPTPMFELMIAAGFDLDTNLVDTLIMRGYGGLVPPHFESQDLPDDYGAWKRSFGGPAMLWLAIRSSYGITEEWDVGVLEFLKREGADTNLTQQFVAALEPAWGDTPTFQAVRAAID